MLEAPSILMCRPDHYGIYYEINPWMNTERQADHQLALDQWSAFHQTLSDLNVDLRLLPPVEGLPDLVFYSECRHGL